ncbi:MULTISPECIES: hypothetical protein [unclassified Fusibacter]|uniref:hypothetical protein n=1 Tax=unclassified Fusibacter TaxID=2624464 RepID=UPI001012D588|nr:MULTISPECIES: hypothetical protein [unclassified Fusibacter]MCK8058235.1 hypothetical protein [Fusibacter sp. A2]NPE20818.1 hypothetical protein [Fusibacter sp. A1]RXV63022.1 hypothetical protein DWB64_03215 [Fusibacter sp. A1]
MENKYALLGEFEVDFDLSRIAKLSVPEKFRLVNFIGLIYQEAHFAGQVGLLHMDRSRNYTINKTYNLFSMLVVNGTKFEILRKIVENYARNFDKSDVYYSHVVMIGIGLMMIDKGFSPDAIYNYLMHLLGKDFLMKNQKYDGIVKVKKEDKVDVSFEIEYEPFEGNMRRLKYELLAILSYSHANGIEVTKELINKKYNNPEFRFYFNMLHIDCAETQAAMFEDYNAEDSRTQRLMLNGAYAILQKYDVFTTHYLFNAVIGKYSRYDKDSGEIETEVKARLDDILA